METLQHPFEILAWHLDAGVDEAMGEEPLDRYALALDAANARAAQAEALLKAGEAERAAQPASISKRSTGGSGPTPVRPVDGGVSEDAVKQAVALAGNAKNLDDLRNALESFDGCPLKKNAMNLVFGNGDADARVMVVGDVPGEDEDRQGVPFVGPSGQLLDKMLASIGLDRADVYTSNTVFWRPPGKRSANSGEIAVCLPFVERMVELVNPQVLVTLGEAATHSLLAQQGSLSRLRSKWFTYENPRMSHPIAACALYHPSFLLKTPGMKRQAWQDLLAIQAKLTALAPA